MMNRALLFASLGCGACLYGFIFAGTVAAGDWPQFLGPSRNGVSNETGLLRSWPKEGPPVLWEKKIGGGFSGPAIAGERLILFHRIGDEEVTQCLDAATGNERWTFRYATAYQDDFRFDDGPRATPLIAGKHVYTLGAEGRLHCLELETGKKVWDRRLNDDYRVPKGFFGVATSPLLEGDILLINIGGKGAGIVGLNRETGKEVWRATDHEASYSSPVGATIDGVRHALIFTRDGIVSLNPADGQVRFSKRWRSRMHASVNAATPVVVGSEVFFSACYDTGAIVISARKDGFDEVWKSNDAMSNHYGTSIHRNGALYGFDGRQEEGARLRCVEWKTGKVLWTREGFGCGSMILADGNLIVLSEEGELVLVEATPKAYSEKARAVVLGKPCRAPIALANGRLYARDSKKLVCWNLKR
jgi:outer membrane protein assembly factor BamB